MPTIQQSTIRMDAWDMRPYQNLERTTHKMVELKNRKYVLINIIRQFQPVPSAGVKGFWGKSPPKFPLHFIFAFCLLPLGSVWSQGTAAFQTRQTWSFPEDGVFFSNDFSGARLNGVSRTAADTYRLTISPETAPINDSPWYAFRVWSGSSRTLTLTLAYTNGTHRYLPKILTGSSWTTLSSASLAVSTNQTEATFPLFVSSTVRTVAGQPLVTWEEQHAWAAGLTNLPFVTMAEIGRSVQNRPLYRLDAVTAPTNAFGTLILMTGQHPPEFTSVTAFRNFVGEILGDSATARQFRRRFNVVIFPLMNPDGWHHGHWRCNANGQDPNRNWSGSGPTNVPEVSAAITALRAIPNPVAFLDFHSTDINVFYTGTDDAEQPAHLVPEFLSALATVETNWTWSRSINDTGQGTSSRSWVAQELGCAAITWEFSDTAASQRLVNGPTKGAQELMKLMLSLWSDATNAPASRYTFENSLSLGQDSAGLRTASQVGTLAATSPGAVGAAALSLTGNGNYLTVSDWDYASGGGHPLLLVQDEHRRSGFLRFFLPFLPRKPERQPEPEHLSPRTDAGPAGQRGGWQRYLRSHHGYSRKPVSEHGPLAPTCHHRDAGFGHEVLLGRGGAGLHHQRGRRPQPHRLHFLWRKERPAKQPGVPRGDR